MKIAKKLGGKMHFQPCFNVPLQLQYNTLYIIINNY